MHKDFSTLISLIYYTIKSLGQYSYPMDALLYGEKFLPCVFTRSITFHNTLQKIVQNVDSETTISYRPRYRANDTIYADELLIHA